MKLGQFLDKVDAYSDVKVDIWVKSRDYKMVSGVPQWVWENHHTVFEKPRFSDEVEEYRNNTLLNCYIGSGREGEKTFIYLECEVKG